MKRFNREKLVKSFFFCLLVFLGLQTVYLSVYGFNTTPFFDEDYGIMRCPDWRFHECYASCLDLNECSHGAYTRYMPLIHFATAGLSFFTFMPVLFWLAVLTAASICLLTALLWQHSNNVIGGVIAVSTFLLVLPVLFLLLFNNPLFSWLDLVLCGLIPFIVVSALFCLLLLEARNLGLKKAFIVFAVIIASHNYGFILAFFAVACLLVEAMSKGRLKATWVALIGFWLWVWFFSSFFFTYSSERVAFLLYFFLALELGRWLSSRIGKGKA